MVDHFGFYYDLPSEDRTFSEVMSIAEVLGAQQPGFCDAIQC